VPVGAGADDRGWPKAGCVAGRQQPGFAYRRVKDERDAADLADLPRMGRLPEAWIAPLEIRELREIAR
jgi:hypothetical protein